MALRTWSALVVVVAAVAIALALAAHSHSVPLRSEHSRPAAQVPAREVVVTKDGKLYHDASCPYIHGAPEKMPAAEAIKEGYTPCTRCMPQGK